MPLERPVDSGNPPYDNAATSVSVVALIATFRAIRVFAVLWFQDMLSTYDSQGLALLADVATPRALLRPETRCP